MDPNYDDAWDTDNAWHLDPDLNNDPQPKKRGPKPGSRNKPKGDIGVPFERLEEVFKLVEHMLPPEEQEYYVGVFSGKQHVDPLKFAELFVLLYTIYNIDVMTGAIAGKEKSQDIAQTLAQYRMLLKDVDDMQRRRESEAAKKEKNEGVVDASRKPKVDRLEELFGGHTPKRKDGGS